MKSALDQGGTSEPIELAAQDNTFELHGCDPSADIQDEHEDGGRLVVSLVALS